MSRLDEASRSVPAGSSPDDADYQTNDDALEANASAAGDADDGGDEPGGEGGRTIDNVRGELLRKMEKQNQMLMDELRALRQQQEARRDYGVPAQTQPQTLDDLSIEQLENMRANVPDEQKAAFEAYLSDRKIDEKVNEKVKAVTSKQTFAQREAEANQMAFDRWPALRDKSSELYRMTDSILTSMGKEADKNPRAILDAANEAGLELGLTPSGSGAIRRRHREPGNSTVSGRSTRPTQTQEKAEEPELSQSEINRLAQAMPGKKFTKEQMKRIAERTKLYKESINTRVRG
jgi:hypothetical protein